MAWWIGDQPAKRRESTAGCGGWAVVARAVAWVVKREAAVTVALAVEVGAVVAAWGVDEWAAEAAWVAVAAVVVVEATLVNQRELMAV